MGADKRWIVELLGTMEVSISDLLCYIHTHGLLAKLLATSRGVHGLFDSASGLRVQQQLAGAS